MTDRLTINSAVSLPMAEITIRASRSSGPGGQHANVTDSRIEAIFDVRESQTLTAAQRARVMARCGPRVTAIAQDGRSQVRNRELALERLADRLARALTVPRPRRATKPTAGSRRRRMEVKRQAAERKRGRRPPAGDDG